jgi:hypothetical protein
MITFGKIFFLQSSNTNGVKRPNSLIFNVLFDANHGTSGLRKRLKTPCKSLMCKGFCFLAALLSILLIYRHLSNLSPISLLIFCTRYCTSLLNFCFRRVHYTRHMQETSIQTVVKSRRAELSEFLSTPSDKFFLSVFLNSRNFVIERIK